MEYQEFKQLSKDDYNLFISKLLYAVRNDLSCYQYATIAMKTNPRKLPFEAFKALPKPEQDELISTMLQNINRYEGDFDYANWIVQAAESAGMFNNVKFNNKDIIPEVIGVPLLS